jgi:hypothetical protein
MEKSFDSKKPCTGHDKPGDAGGNTSRACYTAEVLNVMKLKNAYTDTRRTTT